MNECKNLIDLCNQFSADEDSKNQPKLSQIDFRKIYLKPCNEIGENDLNTKENNREIMKNRIVIRNYLYEFL